MKCPHCGQEHPDNQIECPSTGKMLKRACLNEKCSYFGEHIWPLDKETCPCCGHPLKHSHKGHEFVDLGLSVKWATCNIGANTPEEYGDYFAWGETSPKNKYTCANLNPSDNYTSLEQSEDAAHANWGGNWRMPTDSEIQELLDKCIWEWTKMNNIEGYKVTSKQNNKSIFLSAAGYYSSSSVHVVHSCGFYMSSPHRRISDKEIILFFNPHIICFNNGFEDISFGYSVRPVCM